MSRSTVRPSKFECKEGNGAVPLDCSLHLLVGALLCVSCVASSGACCELISSGAFLADSKKLPGGDLASGSWIIVSVALPNRQLASFVDHN